MTKPVLPLDPITMPLQGLALIEASAGTGKTYTLAALYLRLLLGHGCDRALNVEQILVVTFTEAATQELRERIRKRIQEARVAFIAGCSDDPFISALLEAEEDHERVILDLEFAASEMDQAAIFTIHGFCQRMLKQHAFESGANFNAELVSDDSAIIRQALLDYWRGELYGAPSELASEILNCYASPDALLSQIRSYLGLTDLVLTPDYSDYPLREQWLLFCDKQQALRVQLQQVIISEQPEDDLQALIQNSSVDKRSYSKKNLPTWYQKLADFSLSGKAPWKELERFSYSFLAEKSKTDDVPQHPIFELIDDFCQSKIAIKEVIFCRALRQIKHNMNAEKQRLQQLSFDDLLLKLEQALASSQAEALMNVIRRQYPFALIDEFQDTDPQQYNIFTKIYAGNNHELALLMIGDPKQSIYAFRGADIFTYMHARREVAQHFTLDTNWRSSAAMVNATNLLFQRSVAPFIYDEDIPFYPVKAAAARQQVLSIAGKDCAAMNFWQAPQALNNDQYLQYSAQVCAEQIEQLLNCGELKAKPVNPSSIAVLVRDRKEAGLVQQALALKQIDSVFMSNRDNVFTTDIARALQYLLQAVNEPSNERFLRSALASEIFQYNALELYQINQDEIGWEQLVDEFVEYRQVWARSGVLAMLHSLLQRRALAKRWFSDVDGERRLTDFLHLGELLQQASVELESSEALLRWLSDRRAQPSHQAQEQQLRLDSDRSRVTVITIHKSKGLEYDLVFLPFICRYRQSKGLLYHNDAGEAVVDLAGKDNQARISSEQLAEDLRLVYVAITRAAHACFIGMADLQLRAKSVWQKTAIGYLLTQLKEPQAELDLTQALALLAQQSPDIVLLTHQVAPMQQDDLFAQPRCADKPLLQVRQFERKLDRDWRVTSYSALSRDIEHSSGFSSQKLDIEVIQERDEVESEQPELNIFNFAKGAIAGTFLHSIYEEIDFSATSTQGLEEVLIRRLALSGYDDEWLVPLREFVWRTLDVSLVPQESEEAFSLRQITPSQRLVEMEFVLPFKAIHCSRVNQLLQQYEPLASQGGQLSFSRVSGMLKGFIDLTLRHDGKYYVVDYKSNFLGEHSDDYQRQEMEQALIEHRYDFQYILYTLALHRLLKVRLSHYDYDQHIGGVFYLFLRGMSPGSDNGVYYNKPSRQLIEQLDQLFKEGA